MCNKGIACLSQSENNIDHHHPHQAVYLMDSPSATTNSAPNYAMSPGSNDECPRVKFLCSFLGSILPRPQDGKLRYVGGETRIVSVPRDITYDELMSKMRELYEGAAVLKYQQPDEDLDALVSVVNDDDVTNMMEEYDKLGSGDGFTRLRIFLFSHPDQDGSSHYDGDERDTERRYVDALNNLNDGSDIRKQQPDSPVISGLDDGHVIDQFFNPLSLEGGLHNQRNELPMPQYNLHHLTIPHMGSGQHHQPISQRYSELEAPWSPAYYSPRHHGHHDPRTLAEFPSSPSARYRMPFVDLPDKCSDRMPEEFSRQQVSPRPSYEHQPQYSDNVGWLPSGAISGEKSGFPGNIFHTSNVVEGSSICEHCRMTFQRNQPHFEHPSMGSGLHQVANPCPDCPPRETFMLNADTKLHHGIHPNEQNNEHRSLFNDSQNHERGWILHQQLNARADEVRTNVSGAGRLNDHYTVEGPGMNLPLSHANMVDGRHVSSNYVHHRAGPELGNEVFHDQPVPGAPLIHVPPPEESGIRYGNHPFVYGGDNLYPAHGHVPGHVLWRNAQNPMNAAPSYEASNAPPQVNGKVNPVFPRGTWEGSPRFCIGVDNQNPWVESSQKMLGFDGKAVPDYAYGHALKVNLNILGHENQHQFSSDLVRPSQEIPNSASPLDPINDLVRLEEKSIPKEKTEENHLEKTDNSGVLAICCSGQAKIGDNNCELASLESINSNCLKTTKESGDDIKPDGKDLSASPDVSKLSVSRLSFLPDLIASAKKAALEGAEEVKAEAKEDADNKKNVSTAKETAAKELESANVPGDSELDSDCDNLDTSKIEPTKAEAEAIAKGLQTIKNDDLEEIRELGSGTYGSVYHGKWKGSDVAIKRIKASCFAGRPSERERLIADFWKEALILSSLHHPNVVSFYGIVRDGPDGSLATVTEFMINGSLKQFLQKKDRTIDRRKRLIIAMDAAIGMEYLHGKNIVHFDLKCENLLVNMRDPQRPVCKIGDLGLSKVKQHTLVSGGVRGTLPWMAPELLSGKSNMVTEKIDVYSFGIVMWELLTGDEPYADMHCASIIGGIVNNTLRPQIPTWCDPEWKSLMESCWASDPATRPSFSEISQKLRNMAAAMNVK
ncbi:hypothetical protein FEM48_Zijuj01G0005900 [Ziziphus jujuba var. spinosa]|uniref:Protein kinase domain-containing protein n=1 Tax=Ziziphus jujuba var. spinosa TaxID=714518 RepID=A0A978VY45_ZIZJJ|nr:hypothetical protein FEM48_Zijuj01G0005900 [Ziziphus jujuba var. spinosa]